MEDKTLNKIKKVMRSFNRQEDFTSNSEIINPITNEKLNVSKFSSLKFDDSFPDFSDFTTNKNKR